MVLFNNLDVVGREETSLSLGVDAQPPILVNHINLRHKLTLTEINFVVLGFLVIKLNGGTQPTRRVIRNGGSCRSPANVMGCVIL